MRTRRVRPRAQPMTASDKWAIARGLGERKLMWRAATYISYHRRAKGGFPWAPAQNDDDKQIATNY